jgi:hypothetical protein
VAPSPKTDGLSPLGGAARYPLIEREAVLAEVRVALAQGRHVVLQGEPGVGKTRLLRHLVTGTDGVEQVAVRTETRDEPYAAVAQLLQEVQPRRRPRLGVPEQVELARLAPTAFPGVRGSEARLSAPRLHAALRHWVRQLGQAGVQRLVLDDVHNADAASQAAIGALLAPGDDDESAPLLMLAHRSGEIDDTLAEALVASQAGHRLHCIALQRLTLPGVQALLRAVDATQRGAADTLPEQLLQRTGGNPLFVIELAQRALAQGTDAPTSAADDLEALLRARLVGCSAPAQQLAAVAAVAAADFSVDLATAVMQQPALALMPAWQELQQRALIADHGLAHDLVRDAVLAATPAAITKALHRQTALHLEAQGQQGALVLRHWLAADEPDRALPHAAHHLYATSARGHDTSAVEMALLAVLERVSDPVLLDNLALVSEIACDINFSDFLSDDVVPRQVALVDRVERVSSGGAEVGAWIQYQRACCAYFSGGGTGQVYAEFDAAVQGLPIPGLTRAQSERLLSFMASDLGLPSRGGHLQRALAAAQALPPCPSSTRLMASLERLRTPRTRRDVLRQLRMEFCETRRQADPMSMPAFACRAADSLQYRGFDRLIGQLLVAAGKSPRGRRKSWQEIAGPVAAGFTALNLGRFDIAWACFDRPQGMQDQAAYAVARAVTAMRLGQLDSVRSLLASIDAHQIRDYFSMLQTYAGLRVDLDVLDGVDPVPGLQEVLCAADSHGYSGTIRQGFVFALARYASPLEERKAQGLALLAAKRAASHEPRLNKLEELDVGEVLVEAGDERGLALIREAAYAFRRGRTEMPVYVPEALLRCARLLRASDPEEAAALVHVARRWVLQALPHVPDFARQSFVENVAVHRQLLADEPSLQWHFAADPERLRSGRDRSDLE